MNVKFIFKIDQRGVAPRLRFLKPTLLFEQLARKVILSIPQKFVNVKLFLRNFRENVNFCGITVDSIIKYSIKPRACQIYFYRLS